MTVLLGIRWASKVKANLFEAWHALQGDHAEAAEQAVAGRAATPICGLDRLVRSSLWDKRRPTD